MTNMQVETYQIEAQTCDDANQAMQDGLAMDMIERLGLAGQKKLLNAHTGTRMAFKVMSKLEFNVFETLFPNKTKLKDFSSEVIPVKALAAIDKAVESGAFCRIEIWHSTEMPDPVAVGMIGSPHPQSWDADYVNVTSRHLICRWADALLPFDTLITYARKKFMSSNKRLYNQQVAEYSAKLVALADECDEKFDGRG